MASVGLVNFMQILRSTKGKQMFDNGLDKQLRATLAIASSMSGLWLLGVIALTLVPSDVGSRDAEGSVKFRYQATGVTYAIRTSRAGSPFTFAARSAYGSTRTGSI